jgi:transposase
MFSRRPERSQEAVTDATNQRPTLGVYLTDGRLTIDNGPAERATRPLCVGRRNWLHLGGHGSLRVASVPLSISSSVRRHKLDPWAYLAHVLTDFSARTPAADLGDLLPDAGLSPAAGRIAA